MAVNSKDIIVGIKEIRNLVKVVKDNYDFDFENYATSSLQRRVARILQLYKFEDVNSLIQKLVNDDEFFNLFLEEITVNTTEMFRDTSLWIYLKEALPEFFKDKDTVRIWHAGCSSGEEVYSMAILLKEIGLYDKVSITATDINSLVVDNAKNGLYSSKKMEINNSNFDEVFPNCDFRSYYSRVNGQIKMDHFLLDNVEFINHDLVKGNVIANYDIILCRNVMIYFDKFLQDKVYKLFYESLNMNGILVIGAKESMIWSSISNKFKVVSDKNKIFSKVL